MSKTAVILAGGLGTRLRPYSAVIPKPLVPVGNYPILEIILRQLSNQGFKRVVLAISHHTRLIKAYFGNGEPWNLEIEYSIEEKPLGTLGPLKLIKGLPENFLVMNGDVLTDLDYATFYNTHLSHTHNLSIAYCKQELKSEFGVLQIQDGQLIGFDEKPIFHTRVSMGIYVLNRTILQAIPANLYCGFDQIIVQLIENKHYPATFHHTGVWIDIGRAEDYTEANRVYQAMQESQVLC